MLEDMYIGVTWEETHEGPRGGTDDTWEDTK